MKKILVFLLAVLLVFNFSACTDDNGSSEATILYGDINADGFILSDDALLALQGSIEKIEFTQSVKTIADVDGDGSITSYDSLLILQFSIQKIVSFPVSSPLLEVHFIDVGQGDSIFAELPNGETMLIDAGEKEYGSAVSGYIKDQGYNQIDYLVSSHNHSDHMGGLTQVVKDLDIKNVYKSSDTATTACYKNFMNAVSEEKATVHTVSAGYMLLDTDILDITVLAPVTVPGNDPNNASLVILIVYKNVSFLFMGDAEAKEEATLPKDIHADVVKIGHHGSNSSSSLSFVNALHATYGVISVGAGNQYNHPHSEIVSRWSGAGVSVMRTDLLGTIVISSSGTGISTGSQGSPGSSVVVTPEPSSSPSGPTAEYVLNTSTKKIHLPSCRYASSIKDENKAQGYYNLDQLLADGYSTCKTCLQ